MDKKHLSICVIAEGYPSDVNPFFTFVDQLCCQLADLGHQVTVIAPQSLVQIILRGTPRNPLFRIRQTNKGNKVEVHQPYVISFGKLKLGGHYLSRIFFNYTVNYYFEKKIKEKPDALYGHFWHSAYSVSKSARRSDIPLFIASGENKITICEEQSVRSINDFIKDVKGVICVSTKNMQESIALQLTTENKCTVLPNSFDTQSFYKKNKAKARTQLGFSTTDFIVAFVGSFVHHKGVICLSEAIKMLHDRSIKVIFIGGSIGGKGRSRLIPDCDGILFCGRLAHHKVADYLNCADVFVLPTLEEGCSNAIIEAMACGLPIVSSNRSFNDDILSPDYAIRVDPLNVAEIAESIKFLKDNPSIRKQMSKSALKASKHFNIEHRARKIISFMEEKMHLDNF